MTEQTAENTVLQDFVPQGRGGHIWLKIGSYWDFRNSKKPNEDDSVAMSRIITERNFYRKWATILAWTYLVALCAFAVVGV